MTPSLRICYRVISGGKDANPRPERVVVVAPRKPTGGKVA